MTQNDAGKSRKKRWYLSRRAWLALWLPVALVSYLHYSTGVAHHELHGIFRRLYYIPIVLGAFSFGLKGSLAVSILVSIVYAPHAFTHIFMHDPGGTTEKILEIALYNIVAYITGSLVLKEWAERGRQKKIAGRLKESLEEKKLLEEQLIRTGKLKALGELTAGIAHEIKNPLASVKGAAEAIADEIPEDSPRRKLVEIQKKELRRLSETLERFLSFARPGKFLTARLDLRDLVDHAVELLEPQAAKKEIEIVTARPAQPVFIDGDRDQITQVLVNLVINAVSAIGKDGTVRLEVETGFVGPAGFGIIRVIDSGPGVPAEIREKIFNPFFSTKEGGTGLGLSISANIIERHGGFIRVSGNSGGRGAIFSVFLPLPQRRPLNKI